MSSPFARSGVRSDVPGRQHGLFERTVGGLLWTALGNGGQVVAQVVVLAVLARVLTPEEFGIAAAAMIVVGLSTIFSQMGVGPAIVQRPTLEPRHVETGVALSLVLGLTAFTLVYVTSPLVESFFGMVGLADLLKVAGLLFPIRSAGIVAESLAQRRLRFEFLSKATFASYVLGYGVVAVTAAFLGLGAGALIAGYLGQALVFTGVLLWSKGHPWVPRLHLAALRDLSPYGAGYTLDVLGNYVALQGDNLVAGRVLGAVALGIYGRAYQMMMMPVKLIGTVLDRVLFPVMASMQADVTRLRSTYRRGVSGVALLTLPVSVFAVMFAADIVTVFLGVAWLDVVPAFQILSGGLIFRTGYKLGDSLTRATGAVYRRAWRQWLYAAGVVGFSTVGSGLGTAGIAAGVTLAIILNYLIVGQLSLQLTDMRWAEFGAAHLPAARLAVTWWVVSYAVRSLSLSSSWLSLVVGAVTITGWTALATVVWPKCFVGPDAVWFLGRLRAWRAPGSRGDGMDAG